MEPYNGSYNIPNGNIPNGNIPNVNNPYGNNQNENIPIVNINEDIFQESRQLLLAVRNNDLAAATAAIDAGADVNYMEENVTPLMAACIENNTAMFDLLSNNGVNINYADEHGETALHLAVKENDGNDSHQEIIHRLLNYGAAVNAADQDGNTALLFAAERSTAASVEILLAQGADRLHRNNAGESALDLAANDAIRLVLQQIPPIQDGGRRKTRHSRSRSRSQKKKQQSRKQRKQGRKTRRRV